MAMETWIQRQEDPTTRTRTTLAGLALGLVALFGAPGLATAQYAFTRIDVPGASATYADGNTMNRVVGEFDDENGTHGFVLTRGALERFDVPGADGYTSVNGVNARGQRAGIYFANGRNYGYFWDNGVVTPLDPTNGGFFSAALFVNANGAVVGYSRTTPTDQRHGFIWRNGVFTTVDVPGAGPGGTRLQGINAEGDVVGFYSDEDRHLHGFVRHGDDFTKLDVPGSEVEGGFTFAQGINNYGQIVGYYARADGTDHGFVLSKKGYTTIDVPDSLWTDIYSIDANGNIVGAFEDASGVHGFRGTPSGQLLPDVPADSAAE
jgi:probable HAF family extracellular repeat protein